MMSRLNRLLRRLLAAAGPGRAETELAREIAAHLQLLEDQFIARGLRPADARSAARRAFGGVEQVKEHQRDARSFRWLDDARSDGRLGLRMLVKYPGLTLVGGLGLAVAIAISVSSFAAFYAYLASTLPVNEGDRIVALENWDLVANNEERRSIRDLAAWRAGMTTVEDIGAFRTVTRNLIVPAGSAEPVSIAEMTASGFRVTRTAPLVGRPIVEADEARDAPPVIVIGFGVWRSRFQADPGIVGREIRLGRTVHTVIGVMPEGYAFPVNHGYWVPLRADPAPYEPRQGPAIFIFGRLARGAAVADAQAELAAIGLRSAAAWPTHVQLRPRVLPYAHPVLDIQDISAWWVGMTQATMSLLLVIVAMNVAVLIYARTASRQGEIAIRTALGASRRRIVGQLFIEALVLAGAAAALGLALASVGLRWAHAITTAETGSLPYWIDLRMPTAAVIYAAGLAALAAVIAGVVPALYATGRHVQGTLRQLSGGTGLQLGGTWTLLIVAQVALTVAGLPATVAMVWDDVRTATTRPSFAIERFASAGFTLDPEPPPGMDAPTYGQQLTARVQAIQAGVAARLEADARVSAVTFAMAPPGLEPSARIEIDGGSAADVVSPVAHVNHVAVDFFDAFETPILTGRLLSPADADPAAAIVVNRAFAQRLLGSGPALGRRVRYVAAEEADAADVDTTRWFEIVGVVADLFTNTIDPALAGPAIFHPLAATPPARARLLVRARDAAASEVIDPLRQITIAIDPTVRLSARPMTDLYRQRDIVLRMVTLALGLVIVSVLMLSAAGIYALMSFTVAQRRKEIGIRAALGADAHRLLGSIFARAAGQLAGGVVTGAAAALLLDALGGGNLLGPAGRAVLPAMAAVMIAVGLVAALGPARRGLRIQPTEALREN